jgi:methyl-accepting chemotaxis protein PixJ
MTIFAQTHQTHQTTENLVNNPEASNGDANTSLNKSNNENSGLNVVSEQFKIWRRQLQTIITQMRQAGDIDTLVKITVKEVRDRIGCDRTLIYRFDSPESGVVIEESRIGGWTPVLGETLPPIIFGFYITQDYSEPVVIDNVNQVELTPYQKQVLEKFHIKASLSLPILVEGKVWGLLVANNCASPRQWHEVEISLMSQIAIEFTYRLYTFEVEKQRQQEIEARKAVAKIIDKVVRIPEIVTVFQTTTQEVRQILRCDRVAVYRFTPDWSGEFISESVGNDWIKLVGSGIKTVWEDTHLQTTKGGRYATGETFVVNDIYQMGHSPCHIDILEQFQIKAYIITPLFSGVKLWGLLAAYQNSDFRKWQPWEISFLTQIGMQFGVAITQAEYLEQLQIKSEQLSQIAEQEKALAKIVNRIRQLSSLETIFRTTTQEVRQLLRCDRVTLYRFNPDWSGEFIAESVTSGYIRFVEPDFKAIWEDTYLQTTDGGCFAKGESYSANNVHEMKLTPCYLEILEQLEIRAYIASPVFFGKKLWGLLTAFQHSAPRNWEDSEVSLLSRTADQLGLSLQQAEYLQQLQTQSVKLSEAAEREKTAKEQLQQQAIQLLTAVKPALTGDLRVRAPITEDILGTISDAYNNTLQALRQIVIQLQNAAQQVASTSSSSSSGVEKLRNLAQQQSEDISVAISQLQQMLNSSSAVSSSAELVKLAVQTANRKVESGDKAMNMTVEAIQGIRETVAQTSKKIKRLSESSQKISKVVNLISNFATQTNVLALNAAIEATRAGEYGKGFAVVADEVRSLSRQSAAATIEIEKLVQEIQQETGEVSVAMETGIEQVLEGTSLVTETRQNLNEIVVATAEISQLLQQITEATQKQMSQSTSVTTSMKDVADIANKTFAESNEIAAVFNQLSVMAQELLVTASKFKVN